MSSKKAAWEEIMMAVNAVNSGDRKTVDQVKKRWEDLTASVKKKERQARNSEIQRLKITGNGNLPDDEESKKMLSYPVAPATDSMSSPERQMVDVLGPQAFLGIRGGTDTPDTLWKKEEEKFEGEQSSSPVVLDFNFEDQPAASTVSLKSNREVQEVEEDIVEVKEGTNKRRRKKTLADAQLEYFEVVTNYYKMKMEKMKLEMEILTKKHKEE